MKLKFSAPPKTGVYHYTVVFRSDSYYADFDQQQNIKVLSLCCGVLHERERVCVCVLCVCMCVYMHMCACVYVCGVCVYMHMCACVCVRECVCMWCECVCVCAGKHASVTDCASESVCHPMPCNGKTFPVVISRVQSRAAPCAIGASFLWVTHHIVSLCAGWPITFLLQCASFPCFLPMLPHSSITLSSQIIYSSKEMAQKRRKNTDVTKAFILFRKPTKSVCCFKGGNSFCCTNLNEFWLAHEDNVGPIKDLMFSFAFIDIASMIFLLLILSWFFSWPIITQIQLAHQIAKVWANWPIGLSF